MEDIKDSASVVFGFEEYTQYLQQQFYYNQQVPLPFSSRYVDAAKMYLYHYRINFKRDDFFAANHIKTIFIFSEAEYDIFARYTLDFISYSNPVVDFNKAIEKKSGFIKHMK